MSYQAIHSPLSQAAIWAQGRSADFGQACNNLRESMLLASCRPEQNGKPTLPCLQLGLSNMQALSQVPIQNKIITDMTAPAGNAEQVLPYQLPARCDIDFELGKMAALHPSLGCHHGTRCPCFSWLAPPRGATQGTYIYCTYRHSRAKCPRVRPAVTSPLNHASKPPWRARGGLNRRTMNATQERTLVIVVI